MSVEWLVWLGPPLLFAAALWLSALFSGSETGFYRLSPPRLGVDARAGDRFARRMQWFSRHPAYFVSTCLVGNNIAHYGCTAAVGMALGLMLGTVSEAAEVIATLGIAPLIFLFGDLLPKSVYYAAPHERLRRVTPIFLVCYYTLLPVTWGLVQLTRLLERVTGCKQEPAEFLLGRNRFLQLVQQGRSEGVLNEMQSRLASGLLQLAPQAITGSMIPGARVLGLSAVATRAEMLEFARKFGLASVAVHRPGNENAWYGYAFVAELRLSPGVKPIIHPMPRIEFTASKLEALYRLQLDEAEYGVVLQQERVLGIVARNGLVEQIYRPDSAARASAV